MSRHRSTGPRCTPGTCASCGARRWTPSHALSRFVGFCGPAPSLEISRAGG